MTNAEITATFDHVADLLEYQGGNVFRVRAYRNAARMIGSMVESLAAVRNDPARSLTDLEGIGLDLAAKIETLLDTGRLPLLETLQQEVPAVVFELMRVPGLGPKKVQALVTELGIDSLDALEKACREGRVQEVKGFGGRRRPRSSRMWALRRARSTRGCSGTRPMRSCGNWCSGCGSAPTPVRSRERAAGGEDARRLAISTSSSIATIRRR